jgi:hypothetical protein
MMAKKIILIISMVLAFGFAFAQRTNAGTEMIEPYTAPAPNYNYAPPPPRPIYYAPPPPVSVVVYPTFGPRFGFFGAHRFYGRHGYWRSHRHWR